jgi:type II restriction/modification system DNA methylase subunit YeeA
VKQEARTGGRGEGGLPEILEHAQHVDLPGLDRERVVDLKMDGTRDEELYRDLLLAQCRALHQAMPFLFERVDDETELLLPDNLLQTDSLIRELVTEIPEEDWQEIEIIGWLYQFYISEKKDQVIGKVVKSEDIPAATQLFTPNWIVKYMVQNSLGAQWLATYPQSPLKAQMEYYIEPAEQTDEVKAQLEKMQRDWLVKKGLEVRDEGLGMSEGAIVAPEDNPSALTPNPYTLSPEHLTLIDPACGSGHILVEAYELFKAIYLERGYRQRDLARLILEKNLFGLDIDERAAQLTGFALMMKGRADDRRLFERGVKLNVMVLANSEEVVSGEWLVASGVAGAEGLADAVDELGSLFEYATTFGSLIQVPEGLAKKLPALKQLCEATSQDLFVSDALKRLGPLVQQAEILAAQYDTVVANPPYMGNKYHTPVLKSFLKDYYGGYEKDTFSAFIIRMLTLTKESGYSGIMTSFVWMFISSYEKLRKKILTDHGMGSLVQLHYDAFVDAKAHVCTFLLRKRRVDGHRSCYIRLADFTGVENQAPKTLEAIEDRDCGWFFEADQDDFKKISGWPIAYWASPGVVRMFEESTPLSNLAPTRKGMVTANNDLYTRTWQEVAQNAFSANSTGREDAVASGSKWFPYIMGGGFRKWYGNREDVVNWENDGQSLRTTRHPTEDRVWATNFNLEQIFLENINWSGVTSSVIAFRISPGGELFASTGLACFPQRHFLYIAAFMNSKVASVPLLFLTPTVSVNPGDIAKLPLVIAGSDVEARVDQLVLSMTETTKGDWNAYERSWDFASLPFLSEQWTVDSEQDGQDNLSTVHSSLSTCFTQWVKHNRETIAEMKRLEEENNRLFIDAYGLADELTPDVPIEQITLTVNPAYCYGGKLTEEEQWIRFRQDTMEELVSYAIGCMMGRYSLDAPSLIYAHSGNEGFDPSRYTTFPADDDGIVPLTNTEWFNDDAAHRLTLFISVAWDAAHLEDNLSFLADNLRPKKNESNRETLRRYLCDSFFKNHLKTYKKRPIYWLFSSGKQKAFQCLVYLHRYNEGTLARMRMEYVVPLQGKMVARIDKLADDIQSASSSAQAKRLQKEQDKLTKQLDELRRYDEQLRHYADLRISLDLDDGVKVNYGKFGQLLAEVKAVTGKKA